MHTFFSAPSVSLSWLPTCTLTSRGQCVAKADRDMSPSCLQRYAVYFCRLGQCEAREDTPWSWTPLQSEMLISVTFCLREAIFTRRSSFTWGTGEHQEILKSVEIQRKLLFIIKVTKKVEMTRFDPRSSYRSWHSSPDHSSQTTVWT